LRRFAALTLGLTLFFPVIVQPDRAWAQDTPKAAEINALIDRLGSSDFKQREAAHDRLLKLGDEAAPLLEKAAKDQDAERASQAKEILTYLRWKLPARLEEMLGRPLEDYPSLKASEREQALDKVAENLSLARSLAPFLSNVARFDPDPKLRMKGLEIYMALTPDGDPARDALVLDSIDGEPPRVELHLPRAQLLLRLGHLQRAITEARKAVDANVPGSVIFLADALLAANQAKEAFALLDALLAANPGNLEIRCRIGEACLLAGETQKGEEVFAAILKEKVLSKDVLLRMARAWMRVGRPEDAREILQKAVAKQPYDQDVNVALAELDLALGSPSRSLGRFLNEARYARKDSEEMKRIRTGLGEVFKALGYPEAAADDDLFEDARRGRKLALAREHAARFLTARGLVEEGVAAYRIAAALDPEGVDVRLRLGDGLRRLGRDDEAKKAYDQARAIAPRDERVAEKLRALALGTPVDGGLAPVVDRQGDIAAWDRRYTRDELSKEPDAVSVATAPPVIVAGKVVVGCPGKTTLFALDAQTGVPAWKLAVARPAAPDGVPGDRVGIEIVGLLPVPAAACAAISPRRARDGTPLLAVLSNEWIRSPGHDWRKASFEGALLTLVDPKDGKALGTERLLDEQISSVAPPVARGSRALLVTQAGEDLTNLVLVDLIARRARWTQQLAGGASARPLFAQDLVIAPYGSGIAAFAGDGSLRLSALDGSAPTTGLAEGDGALWFGVGDRLIRASLSGGAARDVAVVASGEVLTGDVAFLGTRVFASIRGGAVRAFDTESGRVLASVPLQGVDRAASRSLLVVGGKLFAMSGGEDSFRDELPALLALDPRDLSVVWRRPVDRPAALGSGEGLVVACSGGISSQGGLRITAARPGAALVDARPRLLQEIRAAAEDALADDESEVAALITRRYVALKGGLSLVASDDLIFFARILVRSRRVDDAESILAVARARDLSPDADKKMDELKKQLGIVKPEVAPVDSDAAPNPPPMKRPQRQAKPGKQKPPRPASPAPDEKKPDDEKKPEAPPEPPK
jgi:tetratricopeptide (TPR) repeat protein